jgi:hypothetical protein
LRISRRSRSPSGVKYQISQEGGNAPVWSPDGKELFYYEASERLVAVPIKTDPSFSFGTSVPLPIEGIVQGAGGPVPSPTRYDITPDGKRFLVLLPGATAGTAGPRPVQEIKFVLNWFEELKQRAQPR